VVDADEPVDAVDVGGAAVVVVADVPDVVNAVVLSISTGVGGVTSTVVCDGLADDAVAVVVLVVVAVVVVPIARGHQRITAMTAIAPKSRRARTVMAITGPMLLRRGAAPGIVSTTVGAAGADSAA
jgi:hypothetical protein